VANLAFFRGKANQSNGHRYSRERALLYKIKTDDDDDDDDEIAYFTVR